MSRLARPVTDRDHILGSTDASIILVEYGDYQCPDCKAAYPAVTAVKAELGNQLALVYRHFPLTDRHPDAEPAAEAAEAADARGRFWAMHEILYRQSPALGLPELEACAGEIGLDREAFLSDVRGHYYLPRVQEDVEGGLESGVRGTPTFFINGVRHEGGHDLASLLAALRVPQ